VKKTAHGPTRNDTGKYVLRLETDICDRPPLETEANPKDGVSEASTEFEKRRNDR
jgi:hypothetical protein